MSKPKKKEKRDPYEGLSDDEIFELKLQLERDVHEEARSQLWRSVFFTHYKISLDKKDATEHADAIVDEYDKRFLSKEA